MRSYWKTNPMKKQSLNTSWKLKKIKTSKILVVFSKNPLTNMQFRSISIISYIYIYIHLKHVQNMGPVPRKVMQTQTPSEVAIFTWKMPNVLNRMKNLFSILFYFSSYGWLNFQFTSMSPCSEEQGALFHMMRSETDCSETDFLVPEFFFCATFSFWDVVDFDYKVKYIKIDHTQKIPYFKN